MDTSCNVCGATRTIEHVYANDCDATCNLCGETRTPSEHVFENNCDADCNSCGATRTPASHVYDDAQDTSCNVCGVERAVDPEAPSTSDTTTKAPDTTTAAPTEEAGCGSALNSSYAVIALVAVIGMGLVVKKREEN